MVFIETPTFTKHLMQLLSDEEYRQFQRYLADTPEAGAVITGTGGMRKVRWALRGKGKSGGVRVIYYYVTAASQIRLILIYPKSAKDSLSDAEKRILKKMIQEWM